METYITSDMHFGHVRIIDFCDRPYGSLEEMNEALVTLWNETVKPEDFVWVLGDAVMGKRDETLKYIGRLNGTKVLIPGNHDYCHPMHKKSALWTDKYIEAGFADVTQTIVDLDDYGQNPDLKIKMCHFPKALGEYDDRDFEKWAPKEFDILIHGHVHDTWKVNDNQINVGMDVWDLKPTHIETVLETAQAFYA